LLLWASHFTRERRSMANGVTQAELTRVRGEAHANCVVCGPPSECGFGLKFAVSEDGSVQATFGCDKGFEGYAGVLHGGVVSCLLDGAMTNCMFAHGHEKVTAELTVRFLHPVVTGEPATLRAWIDCSGSRLHVVNAEIMQMGQVKATAVGKFLDKGFPGKTDRKLRSKR
jgi:uncharacterized protein (TIGR00369 family)